MAPPHVDAEPRPLRVRLAAARPILVVGVLALLQATLGAAAPPPHRLTHVLSAGGQAAAAFVLGADSLYTAQYGPNPNSESAVRRFDLSDGAVRWAAALPQNVQNLVVDDSARLLIARSGVDPKITFLDAGSGGVLWHVESPDISVVTAALGSVLMRADVADGRSELRLVDGRTGRPIWRRTVDGRSELGPEELYGDNPTSIVVTGADGRVTVLRYADGALLSEGDLHIRLPFQADYNANQADFVGVSTVGDRLYVSRRDNGRSSLTAYSQVPFAQLWRAEGGPVGSVRDCAVVLCVGDDRFVSAVSPATGAVRWSEPAWSIAFRYNATEVLAYDQQEDAESALLDAATGRLVRRLGHSLNLGNLLLRADDRIAGRTWVVAVDPADGVAHTVGSLDTAAPFGCDIHGAYLACPTSAGPTMVWRVP